MDPPDQPIPPTRRDEEGLWVPCCTKILVPIKIKDDFLLYNVATPPDYKHGDTFLVHLMYPPSQYKIQNVCDEVSTEEMVFLRLHGMRMRLMKSKLKYISLSNSF